MKHQSIQWALLAIISVCLSANAAQESVWQIPAKALPPPAGASDQLRASIAQTPQPDIAARRASLPRNEADWRAVIAARAASRAVSLPELEKLMSVSIERGVIDGVDVYRIVPATLVPEHKDQLFIYVHGGAYVFGGGDASVVEAARISATAGIPAISIDYRMPPDHPFPAAVDDVVTVYRQLLNEHAPGAMAIGGTSAGGGLALAAIHRFKALGLPVVGAIYAGTPWADLTKTGDTLWTNEGIDRVLVTYDGSLGASALLYANGHDLKDPLLSPLYGDFNGFPPTYLVTGTRDMFLSDTARTHRKLRAARVVADLNVYEGMSHAGYAFVADSPESFQVYSDLAAFLAVHLD